MISVIIPTLNEQDHILKTLISLRSLRRQAHEIIVVDGGSSDATVSLAQKNGVRVFHSSPGRAVQMNLGARHAHGDVFLFLHADTLLPEDFDFSVLLTCSWGRFDVEFQGQHPFLKIISFMINLRSRLTGIATGDQAIFIRKDLFERVGGFSHIPLMEDIALSRTLKRLCSPLCLRAKVTTSGRRWEQHGILKTILLMWALRAAFAVGANPAFLVRFYRSVKA